MYIVPSSGLSLSTPNPPQHPMRIENTPFYSIRIIMHDASSQAVTWLGRGHEEEAVQDSH
jgi:hypothetical protein